MPPEPGSARREANSDKNAGRPSSAAGMVGL
jgi:hypothetical protein